MAPRARPELGSSERRPLTALRGIVALWFVLYHATTLPDSPANLGTSAAWAGLILAAPFGVDLFFMLSGFVLTLNYRDGIPGLRRFLVRRFARIYPLHALTLVALAVMVLAAPRIGVPMTGAGASLLVPSDLPYQFALLHGFVFDRPSWNVPSWPLSALALCYLMFPLAQPYLVRAAVRPLLIALVIALFADIAIAAAFDEPVAGLPGIGRAVSGFVAGGIVFRLGESRSLPKGAAEFAALALVALAAFEAPPGWMMPFGLLLIGALAQADGFLCRWLSTSVPHWLGTISYSVILCHIPAYLVLHKVLALLATGRGESHAITFVALYIAVTLGASELAYRLTERPARAGIVARFA